MEHDIMIETPATDAIGAIDQQRYDLRVERDELRESLAEVVIERDALLAQISSRELIPFGELEEYILRRVDDVLADKIGPATFLVEFTRKPEAPSLKRSLAFLADVMRTLVEKERGYGDIEDHVAVFAPECTAEQRIRTRLDEKLTRLKRLGTDTPDEDTVRDIVGYLALLRGIQRPAVKEE